MVVMASCSSGSGSTPGKALGKYVDELKSGNYENFVEGFALEEGLPAEQAQQQQVDELRAAMPGYKVAVNSNIEVRNISFTDADGDGTLSRKEDGKVTFEIMNNSGVTLYDVHPMVVEATGSKHIHVSPPLRVESIAPGRGVRYTATVYADSRAKDGEALIRVAVVQGNKEITSQVREFRVPVSKR